MPKARSPDRDKAFEIYKEHDGNIDLVYIAEILNLSAGTIRGWKNKDKWEQQLNGTLQIENTERSKRSGAPKGNKNAIGNNGGAPPENKNSEKHGFFSKWLPAETAEIMKSIEKMDPLDILWDNIQLQYTAIIRAQKLMYVKDQDDITTTKIGEGYSDTGSSEKWEVQQAWDKHATFLNAQSRAMKTLEGMMKQYDELLHKNWELATEEQKQRIENLKANTAKIKGDDPDNNSSEDDGFMEALTGKVDDVWQE
ncbi:phage terminase small subunit [Aminipila terrae]|uniref:Terminase n=1 Tax=Aminipila terrae TaxID=2697030 RepID=A0A6P1ME11_9FIRM|nr:phage terminase small subunit [Aminipila terrae]QHI72890.1 terminase [Aminipila terrae]